VALVYLDSSAAAKLVVEETESLALRQWLAAHGDWISSALLRAEIVRALKRAPRAETRYQARELLASLTLIAIDNSVLTTAGELDPPALRTLDAIHLATALRLADEIDAVVTYDRRMIEAATLIGLSAASPV
jgi:predicted nucleic acid-binding protein